jgi:hypothetical protein
MLGATAVKSRRFLAYGILFLGAVWLFLTATGVLGGLATALSVRISEPLTLSATLAIPVLAGLCSLDVQIDWRVRIILFIALLVCVPLLATEFDRHPAVALTIGVIFVAEEFVLVPLINKRVFRNPRDRK